MLKTTTERRRVRVQLSGSLQGSVSLRMDVQVINLSLDGAMVEHAQVLSPGATFPLFLKIDQAKLDRARRLLGAGTEQETVDHALDILVAEETVLRALRKVKGVGGFIDRFAS